MLDTSVFRSPRFSELHAFPQVSMRVTSIDPPSIFHPERKPAINFEGNAIGGTSNETGMWGTVRDEGGDVIRWSVSSVVGGEIVKSVEGVQIGGVQSAAGWVGCWTTSEHGTFDPAGPVWACKLR